MRPSIYSSALLRIVSVLTCATCIAASHGQSAIRCESNGTLTYGETACPPGSKATVIAPTQETRQQRADGKATREELRRDNAAVDKRLDERLKRDTVRGYASTGASQKVSSEAKPRKKSRSKAITLKAPKHPKASKTSKAKGAKRSKQGTAERSVVSR